MLGQQVASLVNGPMAPGRHSVMFQATDLPSGMYLYRLEAGDLHRPAQDDPDEITQISYSHRKAPQNRGAFLALDY